MFYLEFLVKMSKVRFSSKISKEGFNRKMKKNNLEFSKKSYFRQLYEVKNIVKFSRGKSPKKLENSNIFCFLFFLNPSREGFKNKKK